MNFETRSRKAATTDDITTHPALASLLVGARRGLAEMYHLGDAYDWEDDPDEWGDTAWAVAYESLWELIEAGAVARVVAGVEYRQS